VNLLVNLVLTPHIARSSCPHAVGEECPLSLRWPLVNAGVFLPSLPPTPLQVATVLEYAYQNSVEPFLEPVLELSHTILQRDIKLAVEDGGGSSNMSAPHANGLSEVFCDQVAVFLELCAHSDAAVSKAAATCVMDLVRCLAWRG
jgi:hypothetical protein